MTFENAVKKIREKFEGVDASKLEDMAVQVTLTDEDCGGTLYFKAADGAVDVQGYDYRDNDAVIDIERKAFMDILSGKLTLDKAVEKGQATAKGNLYKLESLKAAIPAYVAPAKKPAVKKAEPAKKAEPVKKAAPAKKAEPAKKAAPVKKAEPAKKAAAAKPVAKKAEAKTETKKTAAKKTTVKKA